MFDSCYFLRENKVFPNILHVTMRRSVSIHLLNSLGLVCYVSAKTELGLKQFNMKKKKKHQESKYLWCIKNEMTEGENEKSIRFDANVSHCSFPLSFDQIVLSYFVLLRSRTFL